MKRISPAARRAISLFLLALFMALSSAAQSGSAKAKSKDKDSGDATTFLLIHVVGGKKSVPVRNASVYLHFKEKSALLFLLRRKKPVELDLKTDNNGYASFPVLPQGKLLIQVVAPGWQTFGEYYVLNRPKQTIQIKIQQPKTHWY
jgi:hypothetical protein